VKAVLKGAAYVLVQTPDMIEHSGTTQTTERIVNPDSDYLKQLKQHIRSFDDAVKYAPNQTYIGNMTPPELGTIEFPWYDKPTGHSRFGKMGEIMPQDEFIGLIKAADSFDLVMLCDCFAPTVKAKLEAHPLCAPLAAKIGAGNTCEEVEEQVNNHHAEGLYHEGKLIGCVKRAHDIDPNLNAHIIFENLVSKASGALALLNLFAKNNINPLDVDYIIECSEEACGDMNQRGGGNFAKAIAEMAGADGATGSDTRGFCAAPAHALIQAASLVRAGTFKNVAIVAGGATAKLGMNGKDHVKKGLPILEDVIAGFAAIVSENDFISPEVNTELVGTHTVGTGSSPQAVITALVAKPLEKGGLRFADVDKFSVEMQNPDITKPAGAGDVPEANYKMIAALAVMKKEIERADINDFVLKHGMSGWAPTQGHIPSGVPYLGFAIQDLTEGVLNRVMIVGKGSLFLGRMTNLFDGVSVVLERNKGEVKNDEGRAVAIGQWPATPSAAKTKVGITILGSEHGIQNIVNGAEEAAKDGAFDVVLIGNLGGIKTKLENFDTPDEASAHKKMEELLDSGYLQGCVTMHYNFPIGVSTVGRAVTPAKGRKLFLATTTGTTATDRTTAMVKNAIGGIAAAKACGIENPSVGILNIDGARAVERALLDIKAKGYNINLGESGRADGGAILRGNDALNPDVDVLVADSLTGNILCKLLSSYTTGGMYESSGDGYGPGIGEGYKRLVLILSRASGSPVVAGALRYAAQLSNGNVVAVTESEIASANKAGLADIKLAKAASASDVNIPIKKDVPKEVVTAEISGIEVFDLDDAVALLMQNDIYAESGMGCTGPIVLVNTAKHASALAVLVDGGFVKED